MKRIRIILTLVWATVRIAARRLSANRRMAAGVLVGFIVAVAGASSVPAFAAGALQRMLQTELKQVPNKSLPAAVNMSHFENPKRPTTAAQFREANQIATGEGLKLIGLPVSPFVRYGALELGNAVPVDETKVNPDMERWMAIAFITDLQAHATLTDGRWPKDGLQGSGQDAYYEAVVEEAALDKQDFTVGAEFYVPLNREMVAPKVPVHVVGAFRRKDFADPYWFLGNAFEQQFFVTEPTFMTSVLDQKGIAPGQYSWYYGIANESVKMTDVVRLLSGMYDLEARLAQVLPDSTLFEGPHELLTKYLVRARDLQWMLLLLAVPPLAVVAYFLIVTSGMMVDGQRQEIAVLRSRGASLWQVLSIYVLEGTLLGGLALVGGYPLGILLSRAMGAASGFLQFVDRKQPELMLSGDFWLYGFLAAGLAVLAYVAPVISAARQSIVSYKAESARKLAQPFWAKWFLDFAAAGLAGYAYYTLHSRQAAAAVAGAKAGAEIHLMTPLDVLAPALFVTGFGLLLLRLVPLLFRLVARLAEKRSGAPFFLTINQLSRAPASYTPVVLLLTLTVGMGLYSAAAARTLERNTVDRTEYAGGADVAVSEVWNYIEEPDGKGGSQIKEVQPPPWNVQYDLPGVVHPARVRTQNATATIGGKASRKVTLMAIDPQDFGQVAWFRRDLAPYHLNAYLNLLAQDEEAALVSQGYMDRNKLRPGDRISVLADDNSEVALTVYAAVPYWPSLYPEEQDFVIANLDLIESNLGMLPAWNVWLKMEDGAKIAPVIDALREKGVLTLRVSDTRQALIAKRRDPQLNGLLGGLTSGFLLSAGITLLGFWLYAALSLRSRVLQFGVLRAMGLSVRQLLGAVALEQILSVAFGVAAGTGLGLAAAKLFVPFLQPGTEAAARVPPFMIVSDPADRIRLYVVLLFMLIVGLAGLMTVLSRMRVAEAVKLGEDV